MPETKRKLTKAQAIRDLVAEHGDMTPTQAVERMRDLGLEITPQNASVYLSKLRTKGKRGRKPATAAQPDSLSVTTGELEVLVSLRDRIGHERLTGLVELIG